MRSIGYYSQQNVSVIIHSLSAPYRCKASRINLWRHSTVSLISPKKQIKYLKCKYLLMHMLFTVPFVSIATKVTLLSSQPPRVTAGAPAHVCFRSIPDLISTSASDLSLTSYPRLLQIHPWPHIHVCFRSIPDLISTSDSDPSLTSYCCGWLLCFFSIRRLETGCRNLEFYCNQ